MSDCKIDENNEICVEGDLIELIRENNNMTNDEVEALQRDFEKAFAILFSDEDDEIIS